MIAYLIFHKILCREYAMADENRFLVVFDSLTVQMFRHTISDLPSYMIFCLKIISTGAYLLVIQ